MDIRPNIVIVRPYSPSGFTDAGIYVSLNELWARVWGFVLAVTHSNGLNLAPGDLVLYERWKDRLIDYDESSDPQFVGEKQPIAIIENDDIIASIQDCMLTVPV